MVDMRTDHPALYYARQWKRGAALLAIDAACLFCAVVIVGVPLKLFGELLEFDLLTSWPVAITIACIVACPLLVMTTAAAQPKARALMEQAKDERDLRASRLR